MVFNFFTDIDETLHFFELTPTKPTNQITQQNLVLSHLHSYASRYVRSLVYQAQVLFV